MDGMDGAQHQPFLQRGDGLLLEGSDAVHPPMPVRQPFEVEIGPGIAHGRPPPREMS